MEADIGDELVALDERQGLCFGFSSTAADIWRALDAPRTIDELVSILLANYEIDEPTCRSEVARCLDDMAGKRLVETV